MNKESKIGLLLGLGFIVVIAVLLKGFHHPDEDLPGVTNRTPESMSLPPNLSRSIEMLTPQPSAPETTAQPPSAQPAAGFLPRTTVPEHTRTGSQPPRQSSQGHPGVANQLIASGPPAQITQPPQRTVITPTTATQGGNQRVTANQSNDPLYACDLPSTRRGPEPGHSSSQTVQPPDGVLDEALARLNRLTEPVRTAHQSTTAGTAGTTRSQRATRPEGTTYVVQEGDDLSKIAKKMYGPEQGNRWVNVQGIYEANRDRMKTMDHIRVGQRLRIPPLAHNTTMAGARPGSAMVVAAATTHQPTQTRATQQAPSRSSRTGERYTVREGDSLWSIAKQKLGNGNRYIDIARKNDLNDEALLKPGMTLILPK